MGKHEFILNIVMYHKILSLEYCSINQHFDINITTDLAISKLYKKFKYRLFACMLPYIPCNNMLNVNAKMYLTT